MAVVLLDEAKAALNMTSNADDVELSMYLDAVDDILTGLVGPVTPTAYTDLIDPVQSVTSYPSGTSSASGVGLSGWRAFTLSHFPIVSLTSITGTYTGENYSTDGLIVDAEQGTVHRSAMAAGPWWDMVPSWEPVLVAYTAGWAAPPAAVRLAALIIIEHLWGAQRAGGAGSASPFAPDIQGTSPGLGYAVPPRALELIAPYRRAPTVA